APMVGGPQAHGDARAAGEAPQLADVDDGLVGAAVLGEARYAVDHLDLAAMRVDETRHEHRGVAPVGLRCTHAILEHDAVDAALLARLRGVEQRAEHRVAVELREAAPDDVGHRVDEQRDAAVADEREVEAPSDRAAWPRHRASMRIDSAGSNVTDTARSSAIGAALAGVDA